MYYVLFAIITFVPSPTIGLVDCPIACARCEGRGEEHPGVLEVYCAMCRECGTRRREQRPRDYLDRGREQLIYNLDNNYPEDCPTPPPCGTEVEEEPPYTLAHTIPSTTPTAPTTTRRPCPPVTGCKRPQPRRPRCYYPCLPACPCPYPYPQPYASSPHKLLGTTPDARSTGFIYVYVGVPRDVLQKKNS